MNSHHSTPQMHSRCICLFIFLLTATVVSGADTNQFILQITNRLGVLFPPDAKIENVETNVGRAPLGYGTNFTHEWFAVVTMTPTNAATFKRDIAAKKRDESSQRLVCEDKESGYSLGWFPGPREIPEHIKKWWGEPKPDSLIYLAEFKTVGPNALSDRGGVMVFLSRESGRLWIWSYALPKKDT